MAFEIGNKAWMLRSKHGTDKLFSDAESLWEAACEYFKWCEDNPLFETKCFCSQGAILTEKVPLMRAMTLSQLCIYLGCNESYFRVFKSQKRVDKNDFNTVIDRIEQVIFNQQFQGASCGLLKENIIARNLGLMERTDITSKEKQINIPLITVIDNSTKNELDKLLNANESSL